MTDDLDRIMEVMAAAFDPAYGEAWNRRQVGDSLVLPNTYYLLAASDGEATDPGKPATGFAMSRGAAGEEELLLIAVHPDFRGRGIGRRLIERFFEAARSRGVERVFLEMRDGNPAARLYEMTGFIPVGRRRNYYRPANGTPIDAITYSRDLAVL